MTPELERPDGLTITKMERQNDGWYTARVHLAGETANVDNRYGSWQSYEPGSGRGDTIRKDLWPAVSAALQAKLPRNERRGR